EVEARGRDLVTLAIGSTEFGDLLFNSIASGLNCDGDGWLSFHLDHVAPLDIAAETQVRENTAIATLATVSGIQRDNIGYVRSFPYNLIVRAACLWQGVRDDSEFLRAGERLAYALLPVKGMVRTMEPEDCLMLFPVNEIGVARRQVLGLIHVG